MGFLSRLAVRPQSSGAVAVETDEWQALFRERATGIPLGTAQWLPPATAARRFGYTNRSASACAWIGEGFDAQVTGLGYADDRHVCLVSGTRGGKGVGVIIPNLCLWPGSCVVVDPKGRMPRYR